MKSFFLLFLMFCFSISKAQLKVGSVAPNVIFADLKGESHTLYNYLDSGVTVVFDLFAVWCGPCKVFRNSHVFDSLELHYGMKGNISPRKIKVFSIECDGASMSDITSWSKGNNYSFIKYGGIQSIYPAPTIPQFYVICPNRVIAYNKFGSYSEMFEESFWLKYVDYCPQQLTSQSILNSIGVKVYPNPVASGYINIDVSDLSTSNMSFVIFDFMGKQIQRIESSEISGDSYKLNVDNLAKGVYLLHVITGNKQQSVKFIKG